MSFDIPPYFESEIQDYSEAHHITVDAAILEILKLGLSKVSPAREGYGLFGSPEDSLALDDAVALAYEERRRPSACDGG